MRLFEKDLASRYRDALVRAADFKGISHDGLRGLVREVFIEDLLRPLLPAHVGVSSGVVVDWKDNQSQETDIIVYSKRVLPPLLFGERAALVPFDAVLFCVEVKSKLTATNVQDAATKARRIAELKFAGQLAEVDGSVPEKRRVRPPFFVFAFGSDLAPGGKSELTRYAEKDRDADHAPAVSKLCVAGAGYWFWAPDNNPMWMEISPAADKGEEGTAFLAHLVNSVPFLEESRGCPAYGQFVIDPSIHQRARITTP